MKTDYSKVTDIERLQKRILFLEEVCEQWSIRCAEINEQYRKEKEVTEALYQHIDEIEYVVFNVVKLNDLDALIQWYEKRR